MLSDPLGAVLAATDRTAGSIQAGASLFVAGLGLVLMVTAVTDVILTSRPQPSGAVTSDHGLTSGQFLEVLISGLLLVLAGTGYRVYAAAVAARREDAVQEWVRERAAREADAQIKRTNRLNE